MGELAEHLEALEDKVEALTDRCRILTVLDASAGWSGVASDFGRVVEGYERAGKLDEFALSQLGLIERDELEAFARQASPSQPFVPGDGWEKALGDFVAARLIHETLFAQLRQVIKINADVFSGQVSIDAAQAGAAELPPLQVPGRYPQRPGELYEVWWLWEGFGEDVVEPRRKEWEARKASVRKARQARWQPGRWQEYLESLRSRTG